MPDEVVQDGDRDEGGPVESDRTCFRAHSGGCRPRRPVAAEAGIRRSAQSRLPAAGGRSRPARRLPRVASDGSPASAIRNSLELATLLDGQGFTRYWFAEHHHSAGFAGAAPEILVAAALERTRQLRIGSGGVLLAPLLGGEGS